MILPTKIVQAIVALLEKLVADDDKAVSSAITSAAALDEYLLQCRAARSDKQHLIEELKKLIEADPHAARTPVPPPPPPLPPGTTPPARLTPPPLPTRKRRT